MKKEEYEVLHTEGSRPVKMWTRGVPVEEAAKKQLRNTATLPFIYKPIAVMPDVHLGKGSTIGSVIPTLGAVIPAAVGVDIGCGMMAAAIRPVFLSSCIGWSWRSQKLSCRIVCQ